ncbi:NUDIX hydrolase [Jeotgalibaca caeni]|uniref:NUDIX hydrolase n=1 Tax=Jeotgalibaca caeni TaxID=3028623 RepID=UPI00237E7E04|nr:NUDIX domain-containing protein [Jeotgalibaca caeni]MDE1549613.1 NUDIX domain-containing protein [Jeotgalibaca caeni]
MELWDAYDQQGNVTGVDLVRGEPIPEGLFHIVVEVLVRHEDGTYLLMQRDYKKEGHPGLFEATAGGSALKGETPNEAALRELVEETGIAARELTHLSIARSTHTIFYGYLCVTDIEKDAITLQEGETIGYRWVSRDEFESFLQSTACIPTQRERLLPSMNQV